MDLSFSGNTVADIAVTVAAIVALALALQTAAGPSLMYVVEALKRAFIPIDANGMAGVVAIGVGMVLGATFGLLTNIITGDDFGRETVAYVLCGLIAGLFMGAGAIQNFKAAESVNPSPIEELSAQATYDFSVSDDNESENYPARTEAVTLGTAQTTRPELFQNLRTFSDRPRPMPSPDDIIARGPDPEEGGCDCTPDDVK